MEHLEHSIVIGGLTGWAGDMISDVDNLLTGAVVLVGIVVGIIIIVKRPTVGSAIVGVCVGAFIAGLPWIIPAVGELFRGDIESAGTGQPHAVVEQEIPGAEQS